MKMYKMLLPLICLSLMTMPVAAIKENGPSAVNGLEKSKNTHLYLYEKDPDTWETVGGAWGKTLIKDDSVKFNGHGLEAETDYTLISYVDPWPGEIQVIGSATSDNEGNVRITGTVELDDEVDEKVWLVPSADLEDGSFIAWNPAEMLFEHNVL